MRTPNKLYRLYKPVDIWAWLMIAIGAVLMLKFVGAIDWLLNKEYYRNWWMFWATFFIWCEYAVRIIWGRVYKRIYYDTITHNLFEIESLGQRFLIACPTVEELKDYLDAMYPGVEYKIHGKLSVESFEKTEEFI